MNKTLRKNWRFRLKMPSEQGYTLQTIVISSVLILAVAALSVVIFNVLSDESQDFNKEINKPSTTLE